MRRLGSETFMKCPFCDKEIEPAETTSENRVELHCPECGSIVAAYLKDMAPTLKNLVSRARFGEDTH